MTDTAQSANERLERILDLGLTLTLGFMLSMRFYCSGQEVYEMGSAFIDVMAWFGAFLWAARACVAGSVRIAWRAGLLALPLYAIAVAVAWRTAQGSDTMAAQMFLRHWTSDLVMLLLIVHHAATRERFRFLAVILAATGAVVVAHALYQRWYGLAYFRDAMQLQPEVVAQTIGNDPKQRFLFDARLQGDRVYGPYGYPNALAGILLLFIPLWISLAWQAARRMRICGALVGMAGILALVYTGSKAGFLVAKAAEAALYMILSRRSGRGRFTAAADGAGWMLVATALAGALYKAAGMLPGDLGTDVVRTSIFGVAWWAEILLLVTAFSAPSPRFMTASGVIRAGAVVLVTGACYMAAGAPAGGERLKNTAHALRAEANKHFTERYNYWIAAARMIRERPFLGMGLDAFGSNYTAYKTEEGTAVRKVHNTYLQLWTDGGLLLLAPWLFFWTWALTRRGAAQPDSDRLDPGESPAARGAFYAKMAFVFGVGSYLVSVLFFNALSFEFILAELGNSRITSWPTNRIPGLIHLGAHLLFFPALGIASGYAVWRALSTDAALRNARALLAAGIAMEMGHLFFDFEYHIQSASFLIWSCGGVALALSMDGQHWKTVHIPPKLLLPVRVVVMVAFLAIGRMGPLSVWEWVVDYNGAEMLMQAGKFDEARVRYAALSERWPEWPDPHRRQVECLIHLSARTFLAQLPKSLSGPESQRWVEDQFRRLSDSIRSTAISEARALAIADPSFAANHAFLSRTIERFYPEDRTLLEEALASMRMAIRRHPLQATYHYEAGRIASRLDRSDEAEALFREALRVDALVADFRAKLEPPERAESERWLASKNHPTR